MPVTLDPSKRMWSIAEASQMLGISGSSVRRLAAKGEIRSVRLGRRVLIPPQEIERLMLGEVSS